MEEFIKIIEASIKELGWTSGFIRSAAILCLSIEQVKDIYLNFK